jgi:pyruvate dehydrogenase (quinone)
MPTVAENIVEVLRANGIDRVYGLPGDSLNGITDAIRRDGGIRWVHVRHEEGAAFAAAGESGITGELSVVAGSCGPGNLHLINGLYDANRSRVPVLAIAAHIPSDEIGSNYFQETHPTELFRECSVYCELVSGPDQMPRMLEIALRAAIEKRGVAVLVIPGDVALQQAENRRVTVIERAEPRILPSEAELAEAARMLDAAKGVTILAGAGVAGAHDEVVALADALGAPIVHALRGKEHIEWDNPFDVGMTGLLGFESGYRAMESCDALLMLGTDFPYQQFFPEHAQIIQVDVRGEQLGRRVPLDLGLVGTVKDTAAALLPLVTRKEKRHHLADALEHYARTRRQLDALAGADDDATPLHPEYVARVLDEVMADDAVVIPDVGSPVIWACRYLTMNGRRRLIGSFAHGSMAGALPQAIGVQAAYPDRQVIALAGDGGLTMLLGELLTATQNRLPITVVVVDNSALGFVEGEMKAAGFVNFGTGLENPDFAAVANAMGVQGHRVERPSQLRSALEEALAHDGPSLVDVVCARQELAIPPAITAQQALGFSLYAIRTVMSGGGQELVDLADTNVVRRAVSRIRGRRG